MVSQQTAVLKSYRIVIEKLYRHGGALPSGFLGRNVNLLCTRGESFEVLAVRWTRAFVSFDNKYFHTRLVFDALLPYYHKMTRLSRRGPWVPEEDNALIELVRTQGPNNWVRISQQLRHRTPKQCRERYHQNLKPSLNHEPISTQEGEVIEQLVNEMGKRWAEIARRLGNRSDNAVKNWWNGSMNRRKRTPSHHANLKHISTRLQPVHFAGSHKSPDGHFPMQWPLPEFSSLDERPVLLPTPRQDNFLECNHTSTRHTLFSNSTECQVRRPTECGDSYFNPGQNQHSTARLPPLRLPPLGNHTPETYSGQNFDKPSTSPAVSEFSHILSTKAVPSLVSDNQSAYSISPKTIVSPDLIDRPHLWNAEARAHSYESHGGSHQNGWSPYRLEATPVSTTPKESYADRYLYPITQETRPSRCSVYGPSLGIPNMSFRDERMHLSRLVQ